MVFDYGMAVSEKTCSLEALNTPSTYCYFRSCSAVGHGCISLPRGDDNSGVAFSDSFTLGGNQAIAYSDIWNELAEGQGAGALNVCVENADNAGVISRIYSTGENGAYGQSFDGKSWGFGPRVVDPRTRFQVIHLPEKPPHARSAR